MLFEDVIAVRGRGERTCAPDAALLSIQVVVEAATAAEAHERAARSCAAVDAAVGALGDVVRDRRTQSLHVGPRYEWGQKRRRLAAYVAERTVSIEVTDASGLGRLVAEVVEDDAVQLAGPFWRIDRDNPVHAEARRAATADARARAEAFAAGLHVGLGGIAWVSEPGLRSGAGDAGQFRGGQHEIIAMRSAIGDEAPPPEIDLSPGEHVVAYDVEVGFRLA